VWAGSAGLPELVFRGFLELEKLEMRHAAYRDIAAAVQDLRAGRVHVMIGALPTLSPALQGRSARLLAITATTRAPAEPSVPTVQEAGYPALTVNGLFGFWGGRGMAPELCERIAADVRAAAADTDLVSRLARVGFVVEAGTPAAFVEAVTSQRDQVAEIVRIVGIRPPGR
jgi:tripartite-type tricarboxylate transporter receptor subunit TctC